MTDHARSHRRGGRDAGFTLTEVLIVVVLMGVLSSAIAVAFTTIIRTTPPTEARADDARSLLGISTWLPADVSSTPWAPLGSTTHWDTDPARATGCEGTDLGTNLLRLAWTETLGGATTWYTAAYRIHDGEDDARIERVTCVNGGSRSSNNVTAGLPLPAADPVTITWKTQLVDGIEQITGVEFEIRTFEGDTLRVDASSRNPSVTLSELPTPVTTVAPPTTTTTTTTTTAPPTTTTTTVPDDGDGTTTSTTSTTTTTTEAPPPEPVPCVAGFVSITPNPVQNESKGKGGGPHAVAPLDESVEVRIDKSGDCENLVLRYVRAESKFGSEDDQAEQVRTFGDSITLTLLATPTERWERGMRPLTLFLNDPEGGPGETVEVWSLEVT